MKLPSVNEPEHAAILAGLRLYQALTDGALTAEVMNEANLIATDDGRIEPLDSAEAERLIERLNFTSNISSPTGE